MCKKQIARNWDQATEQDVRVQIVQHAGEKEVQRSIS